MAAILDISGGLLEPPLDEESCSSTGYYSAQENNSNSNPSTTPGFAHSADHSLVPSLLGKSAFGLLHLLLLLDDLFSLLYLLLLLKS